MQTDLKLIAFDVDGTLIDGPDGWTVWEVLNQRFTGRPEVNRERLAAYHAGTLSYADWVALDVSSWQAAGATRDQILEALAPLQLFDGVLETLQTLRALGPRLVVISGTLDLLLTERIPTELFDEIHANHIGFADSGTISHWQATSFDMEGKAKLLRAIAMREGIPLNRTAFLGNSSNDRWVARVAGTTVAFNPDCEELEKLSSAVVHSRDLRDTLPHLTRPVE